MTFLAPPTPPKTNVQKNAKTQGRLRAVGQLLSFHGVEHYHYHMFLQLLPQPLKPDHTNPAAALTCAACVTSAVHVEAKPQHKCDNFFLLQLVSEGFMYLG